MTKSNLNIEELLQQFDAENAHKLGKAAGLAPDQAERLLERGVRTQLEGLATHARLSSGQEQILEAIGRLPVFGSVEGGLTEQGGAIALQTAGEILSPTLLGDDQGDLAGQLSRIEGAPKNAILSLLYMSLPLLLSFLGERDLNKQNITNIMSGIRSGGLRPRSGGSSYVARAAQLATQEATHGKAEKTQAKKSEAQADNQALAANIASSPAQGKQTQPTEQAKEKQTPLQTSEKSQTPHAPSRHADLKANLEPATPPTDKSATSDKKPSLDTKDKITTGKTTTDTDKVESGKPQKDKESLTSSSSEPKATSQPPVQAEMDYSKEDVIAALLDDTNSVASNNSQTSKVQPEKDQVKTGSTSKPIQTDKITSEPSKPESSKPEASQTTTSVPESGKVTPSKPTDTTRLTEPTKPQPTAGAAAIAAAAAAAGVGAGVAASKASAGSPWKSPKPSLSGTQPSATSKAAVGPKAVPVTPVQSSAPKPDISKQKEAVPTSDSSNVPVTQEPLSADNLLETFRRQFIRPELSVLAESTGFSKREALRSVRATVPVILSAIAQKGSTEQGAAELLDLSKVHQRVTADNATLNTKLLENRAELGALEVHGISELGRLMDNPAEVSGRLGTALGVSGEQAGRLLALMAPVVLGLLGSRATDTSAADLSQVLSSLRPRLSELLPDGMGVMQALLNQTLYGAKPKQKASLLETKQAKATAAAAPLATSAAAAATTTKGRDGRPTVAPMQPEPTKPVTPPPPPPAQPESSGGFPWWILIVVLLIAGLVWYFSQQGSAPNTAPTPTTNTAVVNNAATTETDAITGTDADAELNAADIEAAPGTQVEEITPATTVDSVTEQGPLTLLSPAEGETVPDTGFDMSGTGEAGQAYQLFEDGVSVGTFTVDDTGTWNVDVAAPAAGEHTYAVHSADGEEVLSRAITVDVTAAAQCDQDLSLSLNDGENVNAPFRFGGVGNASGYQVRVLRGEEEIGSKDILLASNCTWNYLSQPGGEVGDTSAITYQVRSLDDLSSGDSEAEPLQTITLNVLQAGE